MTDLSISIIDTNNRGQTLECLRAIYANTRNISIEVFVVDNACMDGSAEAIGAEFPQVRLIRNPQKLGFSTNNNRALALAQGRYLMLLNDDTIAQEGALDTLVEFMDRHEEAGAAGANLLNVDGTAQASYDFAPHPLYEALRPFSAWLLRPSARGEAPLAVGSVCGAAMVVRREAVEQVGMLDADFDPLYSEEVEWCFRIQKAGWKIYHVPAARIVHLGSQTMNRAPLNRIERLYEKKVLFFRKHGSGASVWVYKMLLAVSSLGKVMFWLCLTPVGRGHAVDKLRTHWRVATRALFL